MLFGAYTNAPKFLKRVASCYLLVMLSIQKKKKRRGATILDIIGKQWYFNDDIGPLFKLCARSGKGNFLLSPPTPFSSLKKEW